MKNFLKINLDLENMTEAVVLPNNETIAQTIHLGVTKNIDLSSFKFEIRIYDNDKTLLFKNTFPTNGFNLIKTDLDILKTFNFFFLPAKKYIIEIEYNYKDNNKNLNFDFVGTKPPKPFKSWVWNKTEWVSPVPFPDNVGDVMSGEMYEWNEEKLVWMPLGGYTVE